MPTCRACASRRTFARRLLSIRTSYRQNPTQFQRMAHLVDRNIKSFSCRTTRCVPGPLVDLQKCIASEEHLMRTTGTLPANCRYRTWASFADNCTWKRKERITGSDICAVQTGKWWRSFERKEIQGAVDGGLHSPEMRWARDSDFSTSWKILQR